MWKAEYWRMLVPGFVYTVAVILQSIILKFSTKLSITQYPAGEIDRVCGNVTYGLTYSHFLQSRNSKSSRVSTWPISARIHVRVRRGLRTLELCRGPNKSDVLYEHGCEQDSQRLSSQPYQPRHTRLHT